MIPISEKDISRIFGKAYLNEKKASGIDAFYLFKKREGASLFWFIMGDKNNKKTIVRRLRSTINLSKLLGVDDKFEQEYESWEKILSETEQYN